MLKNVLMSLLKYTFHFFVVVGSTIKVNYKKNSLIENFRNLLNQNFVKIEQKTFQVFVFELNLPC